VIGRKKTSSPNREKNIMGEEKKPTEAIVSEVRED
jgi:hypothetical protein